MSSQQQAKFRPNSETMAASSPSNVTAAVGNGSKPADGNAPGVKIDGRCVKRRKHPKKMNGQPYGAYMFEKQVKEKFGTMKKGHEKQVAELGVCAREPEAEHVRQDVKLEEDEVEIKGEPED